MFTLSSNFLLKGTKLRWNCLIKGHCSLQTYVTIKLLMPSEKYNRKIKEKLWKLIKLWNVKRTKVCVSSYSDCELCTWQKCYYEFDQRVNCFIKQMRWLHYALRYSGMCTYVYIRMYIKCNGLETKRKQKEKNFWFGKSGCFNYFNSFFLYLFLN